MRGKKYERHVKFSKAMMFNQKAIWRHFLEYPGPVCIGWGLSTELLHDGWEWNQSCDQQATTAHCDLRVAGTPKENYTKAYRTGSPEGRPSGYRNYILIHVIRVLMFLGMHRKHGEPRLSIQHSRGRGRAHTSSRLEQIKQQRYISHGYNPQNKT